MKRKPEAISSARQQALKLGAMCHKCPLNGQVPVLGEGSLGAQLAIIGEAPGRDETKMGRPFIGRSGEALEKYLAEQDLTRPAVFITNAVLCFPPGGDYDNFIRGAKKQWKATHGTKKSAPVFNDPIECCRPRLFNELRIDKCKKCGRYLGAVPDEWACVCSVPARIRRHGPPVLVPMGNAAMEAVLGFEGISKWRGSALKRGR